MREAIALSIEGMRGGSGGPFGAVVVEGGEIIGRGCNRVLERSDPTAHAEVEAIRDACRRKGTFLLKDCELFTSCEPCPMCLGAIYWARIATVYFGNTREDAAAIGFDDNFIYTQIGAPRSERKLRMVPMLRDEAQTGFREWSEWTEKRAY